MMRAPTHVRRRAVLQTRRPSPPDTIYDETKQSPQLGLSFPLRRACRGSALSTGVTRISPEFSTCRGELRR